MDLPAALGADGMVAFVGAPDAGPAPAVAEGLDRAVVTTTVSVDGVDDRVERVALTANDELVEVVD